MGAYYEDYMIKGKASQSEVNDWLENQQAEDNACNGHRHGYSADTQTINRVELHDVTFKSYAEASEYCGQMAQKWEYGVAVYVEEDSENPYTYIGAWCAC